MEINVLIEEGFEIRVDGGWMQEVVEKALLFEAVPVTAEISLLITGQERIQELNREYRGKDRPTDVLSFSMAETKAGKSNRPLSWVLRTDRFTLGKS